MKSNLLLGTALACAVTSSAFAGSPLNPHSSPIQHIVVIYQENHSFDNLYGHWGPVNGQAITTAFAGGNKAQPGATQVQQNGAAYGCLPQLDVNLTSPSPLATTCTTQVNGNTVNSAFVNQPFDIDTYIPSTDTTCPSPLQFSSNGFLNGTALTGGCTRDIVHRFYEEQYQIDNGKMDRYTTGSDAAGLTQGYYDTTKLPIYTWLHSSGAPNYVIADHFFQGAFGGSFANHQMLITGTLPLFAGAPNDAGSHDLHSVLDTAGFPASNYPNYQPLAGQTYVNSQLTQSCTPPVGRPAPLASVACGDYVVNTTQPTYQPFSPGTASYKQLPPLTSTTIGDQLTAAGVDWAWYSGGWDNANGNTAGLGWTNGSTPGSCMDPNVKAGATYPNCPDGDFQFHHQPFNYYSNYAPGTTARSAHLLDEAYFIQAAQNGTLKPVSFVKFLGENNEHPGYASESAGSNHLVNVIQTILNGPEGNSTLVIVTYDEFGGQWDHVAPPGTAGGANAPHDKFGPSTRIPAILISAAFTQSGVDHTTYDTTSILKTIETRFKTPCTGNRDCLVKAMTPALVKGGL